MRNWLVFFASLAFGALFLWSGVLKIKDPISFADAVRNFRLVGDPMAPALAHFLPWLEVFAGVAVMIDRTRRGAALILTLLLLGFTGAILLAWMRGLDIACGCFGGEETMNYPLKIAQNTGLVIWGGLLWWMAKRGTGEGMSPARSSSENAGES